MSCSSCDCPLCDKPLVDYGPTIHCMFEEMEEGRQIPVVVHLYCAWTAIKDMLDDRSYHEGEEGVFDWRGWEPVGLEDPYRK